MASTYAAENVTRFFNTKIWCADILPLYRLNKRQGKQLLQELTERVSSFPIEKVPIADLEEENQDWQMK